MFTVFLLEMHSAGHSRVSPGGLSSVGRAEVGSYAALGGRAWRLHHAVQGFTVAGWVNRVFFRLGLTKIK